MLSYIYTKYIGNNQITKGSIHADLNYIHILLHHRCKNT
uniref:Uncharacterized protein n=1 Tax=Arundo donax TaxID=35708 RepID=A0A0A9FW12_ARUDO